MKKRYSKFRYEALNIIVEAVSWSQFNHSQFSSLLSCISLSFQKAITNQSSCMKYSLKAEKNKHLWLYTIQLYFTYSCNKSKCTFSKCYFIYTFMYNDRVQINISKVHRKNILSKNWIGESRCVNSNPERMNTIFNFRKLSRQRWFSGRSWLLTNKIITDDYNKRN